MTTYRETETQLKEGIVLERRIRFLLQELQTIRNQYGEIVKPLKTDGGGRGNLPSDPVGNLASEVADEEDRILEQIQEARRRKQEIRNTIEVFCEDEYSAEVLKRRFLSFQSFETIADEMFMSLRNVFKLRRKGIQEITRRRNEAGEKSAVKCSSGDGSILA